MKLVFSKNTSHLCFSESIVNIGFLCLEWSILKSAMYLCSSCCFIAA